MANSVNKALILRFLDKQCTPEEAALVAQWLRLPGSDAVLDEILNERLQEDMQMVEQDMVSPEKAMAWKAELHRRIGETSTPIRKLRPRGIFRHAAVWAAVLFGIGFYAIYQAGRQRTAKPQMALLQKKNPMGQRASITLTDGSVVLLGADSRLVYPETFNGSTREVTLEGEAFFEISENPQQPFIVHTGDVQTKVLGTSFRISAFKGSPVTVAVATGKVRVDQKQHSGLLELAVLTPGRQVTWNGVPGSTAIAAVNVADVEGWKSARLVFNNRSLKEVAAELERWYNVNITFERREKAAETITVTLFAAGSLEKTLQTLSVGSNFRYEISERQITIY